MTPQASSPTVVADAFQFGPNFQAWGNTYLIWGTDGVLQKYLVTSVSNKDRIIDNTIEQGAGFSAIKVLMKDGNDIEIEVVYTTQFAALTIAQNPFIVVTPDASYLVLMVAQNATLARKREGMRSWTFQSYTAISLPAGTPL